MKRTFAYTITAGLLLISSLARTEEAPRVVFLPLFDDRTGNAVADDVISGATFSNSDATGLTGTMPDNGTVNLTPGTTAQVIAEGYHSGFGAVAGDTDLAEGNIKSGVEIFGTTGTVIEADGNAAASHVLAGKIFSNSSAAGLTGTMPNNGAVNITPGKTSQAIGEGYHDGTGSVAGDTDLVAGNIKSGVEIFGTTGTVIEASGDAAVDHVLAGQTFSNAGAAALTGAMPNNGAANITPGSVAQAIVGGYHNGFGTVAGDADLATGNIKSGVEIFGIAGDPNVVDTTSGDAVAADIVSGKIAWVDGIELTGTGTNSLYPAPIAKTGQTASYGTGDDGDIQKGVAWPNPRFTDNGDGTVVDNLTGLIWLKNANCYGNRSWTNALIDANGLADGSCGLSDGSTAGDWRVPNLKELFSLVDLRFWWPAISNTAGTAPWAEGDPFTGLPTTQYNYYCTSTTQGGPSLNKWGLNIGEGRPLFYNNSCFVWPVRGGQ